MIQNIAQTQILYDKVVNHLRFGNKTYNSLRGYDNNGDRCYCAKGILMGNITLEVFPLLDKFKMVDVFKTIEYNLDLILTDQDKELLHVLEAIHEGEMLLTGLTMTNVYYNQYRYFLDLERSNMASKYIELLGLANKEDQYKIVAQIFGLEYKPIKQEIEVEENTEETAKELAEEAVNG